MGLTGDRETFAIEIGEPEAASGRRLQPVDIWIAGQSVCCDDNMAFVPSFRRCMRADLYRVQQHEVPPLPAGHHTATEVHRWCRADTTGVAERHWFMHWGETTDNLITHFFRVHDRIVITSQFWRDHMSENDRRIVLVAELSPPTLEQVLHSALDSLTTGDA